MKNQILRNLILSALVSAPLFAENGTYNKKNMRPFFTLSTDYRMLVQSDDINSNIFNQAYSVETDYKQVSEDGNPNNYYTKFDDHLGPYINIGAGVQLNQFELGANYGLSLPQASTPKFDKFSYVGQSEKDSTEFKVYQFALWDAKYFISTFDFKFAYLLFPESSPFNIVPSISTGWTFLHVQFGGEYDYYWEGEKDPNLSPAKYRKGYYSTNSNSVTLTPELEVRLKLGQSLTVAGYGGYRPFDFEDIVTESDGSRKFTNSNGGGSADTYYAGLRASWYLLSAQQKEDAIRE
jgi:hypothetical protein